MAIRKSSAWQGLSSQLPARLEIDAGIGSIIDRPPSSGRGIVAAYYLMLLSVMLPMSVERFILIDADTIVVDSVLSIVGVVAGGPCSRCRW